MWTIFNMVGCHQASSIDELERYDLEMRGNVPASSVDGRVLTDVAGKPVVPVLEEHSASHIVDKVAQPFVGRYYVSVSCDDPMVSCDSGTADFILNLLPDGTAHRTIIHLGTITFESHKQYRQDTWSYQPELNQITLHRATGVEFYYNVTDQDTIVMNREKIRNFTEKNIEYFNQGGAFPLQDYRLVKKNA